MLKAEELRWLEYSLEVNQVLGGNLRALYTIHLPLHYNDKTLVEHSVLEWAQSQVLRASDGVSRSLAMNGIWKGPQRIYDDWNLRIQADGDFGPASMYQFRDLAHALGAGLRQLQMYVYVEPIWRIRLDGE